MYTAISVKIIILQPYLNPITFNFRCSLTSVTETSCNQEEWGRCSKGDNSTSGLMIGPLGECLVQIMTWLCQFPGNFCLYFRSYRLFRTILFVGLLLCYCEFVHYYVVLFQCTWPQLNNDMFDRTLPPKFHPLRVMVIADTHLLGEHGHWFDRLRRYTKFCLLFKVGVQFVLCEWVLLNTTSAILQLFPAQFVFNLCTQICRLHEVIWSVTVNNLPTIA